MITLKQLLGKRSKCTRLRKK